VEEDAVKGYLIRGVVYKKIWLKFQEMPRAPVDRARNLKNAV